MRRDEADTEAAELAFNAAMVSNDVEQIRRCITANCTLVTPERGPVPGARLLSLIEGGVLGHSSMSKQTHLVRVWGDLAVVIGRGTSTGWYRGAPIAADEWVCDIYRRVDGARRCELTQLTPVAAVPEAWNDGD